MVAWLLEAAFYAGLAAAVTAINWRRRSTRIAGAALLCFSLLSSASFFVLHGADLFHLRVMREVLLITPIATMFAFLVFIGEGRVSFQIALLLCLIDVIFCTGLFLYGEASLPVRTLFGWVVNIVFIGLCACTAVPGIRDAYAAWIASIERMRRMDSSAPDLDWALRNLDR